MRLDGGARQFAVVGVPKAQPRPRVRGRGRGVYDPGTANEWKKLVRLAGRSCRPKVALEGPVAVAIKFLLPRPKRLYRKADSHGELPCNVKPDIDNLAKAVLDALTDDGWWWDDAQIDELHCQKWYHAKAGRPGAVVTVQGKAHA